MTKSNLPLASFPLRIERHKLDRMAEIAAAENRSLVQALRVMINQRIEHEDAREREAA